MRQIPLHAMQCHATSSKHCAEFSQEAREKERKMKKALSSYSQKTLTLSPPRQRPRHPHHHLALAETPEINRHAYYIIDPRVRALIQQQGRQAAQRVDEQSGFDTPMHRRERRRCPVRRSRRGGVGVCVFVAGPLRRVAVGGGGVVVV